MFSYMRTVVKRFVTIGRAISLDLAIAGIAIAVNTRRSIGDGESVAREIRSAGDRAGLYVADIAEPVAVKAMVANGADDPYQRRTDDVLSRSEYGRAQASSCSVGGAHPTPENRMDTGLQADGENRSLTTDTSPIPRGWSRP